MKMCDMSPGRLQVFLDANGISTGEVMNLNSKPGDITPSQGEISVIKITKPHSVGSIAMWKGKITFSVGFEDKVSLAGLRKMFPNHHLSTRLFSGTYYVEFCMPIAHCTSDDVLESIRAAEYIMRRYKSDSRALA